MESHNTWGSVYRVVSVVQGTVLPVAPASNGLQAARGASSDPEAQACEKLLQISPHPEAVYRAPGYFCSVPSSIDSAPGQGFDCYGEVFLNWSRSRGRGVECSEPGRLQGGGF